MDQPLPLQVSAVIPPNHRYSGILYNPNTNICKRKHGSNKLKFKVTTEHPLTQGGMELLQSQACSPLGEHKHPAST